MSTKMAAKPNKTLPTGVDVDAFVANQPSEAVRDDCRALIELMGEVTGEKPRMWGPTIIGFGSYHYRYASGREGDAPVASFSPRRPELVIYLYPPALEPEGLTKLGRHRATKGCLYVKRLDDIDMKVLRALVKKSMTLVNNAYPQR